MSDTIKTGCSYRIMTDLTNKIWSKISFWKKAVDVEFNDGKTAQTKVGAITGITDSLTRHLLLLVQAVLLSRH